MKRRQFLKRSLVTGASLGIVGGGLVWLTIPENSLPLTVSAALKQLGELTKKTLKSSGDWNPYQIFSHCAQSIEYSMTGYPVHKSELFKSTAGSLAFSAFSSKGQMTHGLNEAIPGAPNILAGVNTLEALERLRQSFVAFQAYEGNLEPHFAYGELSKQEYEKAHVMHFYNHLDEIAIS